ncbi:MAG: anti-sigma factor [Chloroflexota bacterium]
MTLNNMNRNDLLDLIPAYALDALDADEKPLVEALLKDDTEAQQLLQEYQAVTSALAFHVPERPAPPHLRAGLQAKLAESRQQNADKTITVPTENRDTSSSAPASPTNITRFPTTILLSVAAAVIVLVIGIVAFLNSNPTSAPSPNELLYNELFNAEGTSSYSVIPNVATDVTGELLVSADNSEAVLRIASLPDTTEEQSYQLWLITDDQFQSGGVFHWPTGHGPYFVGINPDLVGDIVTVGMTIEPFDGSPLGNEPSSEQLFSVEVTTAN